MLRPSDGEAMQTSFPAGLSHPRARYFSLRKPSLTFALRASLRLFKFVPDEFVRGQRQVCREQTWSCEARPKGLCLDKHKTAVSKRKAARLALDPARRGFRREAAEGLSIALCRRASSLKRPYRVEPAESPGARRGKRGEKTLSTVNADITEIGRYVGHST